MNLFLTIFPNLQPIETILLNY